MDFQDYLADLTAACEGDPRIVGLVLLGSTAEQSRADEHSDHDFFIITPPGGQEELRSDLGWLPHHERISTWARETQHGLKVMYDDGHVLEFAVFDLEELRGCKANHWAVAYGAEEVVEATRHAATWTLDAVDVRRAWALFTSLLVIGVGRARRGEVITAGQSIRSYALMNLLHIVTSTSDDPRLDALDPSRRIEQVFPSLGHSIGNALSADPESCARELLNIGEEFVRAHGLVVDAGAAQAVRLRFDW